MKSLCSFELCWALGQAWVSEESRTGCPMVSRSWGACGAHLARPLLSPRQSYHPAHPAWYSSGHGSQTTHETWLVMPHVGSWSKFNSHPKTIQVLQRRLDASFEQEPCSTSEPWSPRNESPRHLGDVCTSRPPQAVTPCGQSQRSGDRGATNWHFRGKPNQTEVKSPSPWRYWAVCFLPHAASEQQVWPFFMANLSHRDALQSHRSMWREDVGDKGSAQPCRNLSCTGRGKPTKEKDKGGSEHKKHKFMDLRCGFFIDYNNYRNMLSAKSTVWKEHSRATRSERSVQELQNPTHLYTFFPTWLSNIIFPCPNSSPKSNAAM